MKEIIIVTMLLITAFGMGCVSTPTAEEKQSIQAHFASEMAVLVFDEPNKPSIQGLNLNFIDNPTSEDCDDWIIAAEKHLATSKEYREILFVDAGDKYDKNDYNEYVSSITENIAKVESYKGAAKVFDEMSRMIDRYDELSIDGHYTLYEFQKEKLTREEFYAMVCANSKERRDIWISIRHIVAENESGYFDKSDVTLEYIKGCDDIISLIDETIELIKCDD